MTPADLHVRHGFEVVGGHRVHYVERGEGPVVLLLHGFPETWWSWRHQLEPLASAGYRVVAPDLRGFGESGNAGPFDLDTVSDDLCTLLDRLGSSGPVRIAGHDWGGAVTWHLAATRPERCLRVAVLSCPHPAIMRRALFKRPNLRQLAKSWYMLFFQLPRLPEWVLTRDDASIIVKMLRGGAFDRAHFEPEELWPFREAALRPGNAKAMVDWYRTALRERPRRYPTIERDTMLIWPLDDTALDHRALLPGHEKLVESLEVLKVEHCGHWVQAERPALVNEALLRHFDAQITRLRTQTGS